MCRIDTPGDPAPTPQNWMYHSKLDYSSSEAKFQENLKLATVPIHSNYIIQHSQHLTEQYVNIVFFTCHRDDTPNRAGKLSELLCTPDPTISTKNHSIFHRTIFLFHLLPACLRKGDFDCRFLWRHAYSNWHGKTEPQERHCWGLV